LNIRYYIILDNFAARVVMRIMTLMEGHGADSYLSIASSATSLKEICHLGDQKRMNCV